MACDPKTVNVAVSRVIPVVLCGLVGYGSFAFTKPFCIDYLIDPSARDERRPRIGLAAGLLIVFYFLLFFMIISYVRLFLTIIFAPGYLPRGPQWSESTSSKESRKHRRKGKTRKDSANSFQEKKGSLSNLFGPGACDAAEQNVYPFDAFGLEAFYMKDVFVCQQDGRPPWCSSCYQFKSDRAHHCSEVGRCVRKMDHFCPWVGGVVSETSFKFFIQFLFYGLLFTAFNIIVMAIFLAEVQKKVGFPNIHWILGLALSGLFGFFAFGMLLSALRLALLNSSTIESFDRRSKVWTLAILVPRPEDYRNLSHGAYPPFPMVSYPGTTSKPPSDPSVDMAFQPPRREFVILNTKPGENPFDLGSPFANLKEVMGYSLLEWLLPVKHSPCAFHGSQEDAFRIGPAIQRMKKEAGLDAIAHGGDPELSSDQRRSQTKNKKRRSAASDTRRSREDKSSHKKAATRSRSSKHSHHGNKSTRAASYH